MARSHHEEVGLSSRRKMLSLAGIGAVGAVAAACVPPPSQVPPGNSTPPTPTQPLAPLAAAQHLARRATFGATQGDVQRIRSMGTAAWLDQQLSRSGLVGADNMLSGYVTLTNTNEQNYQVKKNEGDRIYDELDHATLIRAVYSQQQLYEVMCDFWTNHFNIWRRADWLVHLKTRDNESVIRKYALGKFSDLLMASAKSPAMLVYLDNYQSRGEPGQQVNENYGRELLELHTLGIIDGTHVYSEADIVGVAKVLSGWGISWDAGSLHDFRFNYWNHNRDAVSILGGAWKRPARPNWGDYNVNGLADGESLIRFLARHQSTARHLATKLARRFVSDFPSPALVQRLASVYLANDTAIAPVLRELFLSPEFNASANQKVKRPVDWMISALRSTGATVPTAASGKAAKDLRKISAGLGQPLFERVSPDGWPEAARYWVGSDGLLKRWEYGASLARSTGEDAEKVKVNLTALLPTQLPSSSADLVTWLGTERFQLPITSGDAAAICTAIGVTPTGAAGQIASNAKQLQGCVALLLAHPAFQRR
ncbi:MAG: DUF1800 domain-containing protein [Microthrixaceae bacterium]|nr:DUF1800 domain-containing protein [Microthrixaceae bacterium]